MSSPSFREVFEETNQKIQEYGASTMSTMTKTKGNFDDEALFADLTEQYQNLWTRYNELFVIARSTRLAMKMAGPPYAKCPAPAVADLIDSSNTSQPESLLARRWMLSIQFDSLYRKYLALYKSDADLIDSMNDVHGRRGSSSTLPPPYSYKSVEGTNHEVKDNAGPSQGVIAKGLPTPIEHYGVCAKDYQDLWTEYNELYDTAKYNYFMVKKKRLPYTLCPAPRIESADTLNAMDDLGVLNGCTALIVKERDLRSDYDSLKKSHAEVRDA